MWSLVNHSEVKPGANAGATEDTEETEVVRWEGGVPPELLRRLKAAFAQDSPFWRETDYAERGYFSFWHDAAMPPRTVVDELAMTLLPLTGHAERIVGFEWWVHTRAEARSIGHQMHFDTEEASLAAGRLVQRACRSSLGPQLAASASWGELYRLLAAPPTQGPTQGGQLSR